MANIKIGKQFKEEFASIYHMFEGINGQRYISDAVGIKSAREKRIETWSDDVFEYIDSADGGVGTTAEGSSIGIGKQGASWFEYMRHADDPNWTNADLVNSAKWKDLIKRVAADYHKNYSFIEFVQQKDRKTVETEKKIAKRFVELFLRRLFNDVDVSDPFADIDSKDDIYGLSLRLELSSGMGETEPVLCKVYFRRDQGGKFTALTCSEAQEIETYFSHIPDDSVEQRGGNINTAVKNIIEDVLNAFDEMVVDRNNNSFAKSAYFGEQSESGSRMTDADKIHDMLSRLSNSEDKLLKCTKIDVLGVSHVSWQNAQYFVNINGKRALCISIGLNSAVSLHCVNCNAHDRELILNNEITLDNYSILLDPNDKFYGVNDDSLDEIRNSKAFSKHLKIIRCPDKDLGEQMSFHCSRVVCESQMMNVGMDKTGNPIYKCKNCMCSEIVYRDIFAGASDEVRYTPLLDVAYDECKLEARSDLVKCRCCGRTFTQKSLINEECYVCRFDSRKKKEAKVRYSTYKNMLDPATRFRHVFSSKKYCNEDDDIVVFILGGEKFVFEKVNANETGYISKPVKVKRSKK